MKEQDKIWQDLLNLLHWSRTKETDEYEVGINKNQSWIRSACFVQVQHKLTMCNVSVLALIRLKQAMIDSKTFYSKQQF